MPLKNCLEAATNLDDADVAVVMDGYDTYIKGMGSDEAARLATDDAIASVTEERAEFLALIYETYPDLNPDKAPASTETELANTEDVGQELAYNRRQKGITADDILNAGNDAEKLLLATKTKIWARPDYQKMVEDGVKAPIAHIVKQIYDKIGNKPYRTTDEYIEAYARGVETLRDAVSDFLADNTAQLEMLKVAMKKATQPRSSFTIIDHFTKSEGVDPNDYIMDKVFPKNENGRRVGRDNIEGNLRAVAMGKAYENTHITQRMWMKAFKEIDGGWPAKKAAWQRSYTVQPKDKAVRIQKGYKFDPKDNTKIDTYNLVVAGRYMQKFKSNSLAEEAVQAMPEWYLIKNKGGLVDTYSTQGEAIAAVTELTKRKSTEVFKEPSIPIEKSFRDGADIREGLNVSTQQVVDTIGFKGINFGNWMKGSGGDVERQAHTNSIYDSAHDLASLLGIPVKAISLDGMLGIAVGAQGRGGKQAAAAHFVPGLNEINITRGAGAGSLAHEWAHGLDHYFGVLAGMSKASEPFLSDRTYGSHGTVRTEIVDAFKKIMDAMTKIEKDYTAKEIEEFRVKSLQRDSDKLNGWLEYIRPKGDKKPSKLYGSIEAKLVAGDVGEMVKLGKSNNYVGETVNALREEGKKINGRYMSLDAARSISLYSAGVGRYKDAQVYFDNHPKTHTVKTQYQKDALGQESASGKPYWSTPWEMFARAFESYVLDKLDAQNLRNDYLTAEWKGSKDGIFGDEATKRFPQGEEREKINEAFDVLVEAIKTKETDRGTMLYRVDDTAAPEGHVIHSQETKEKPKKGLSVTTLRAGINRTQQEYPGLRVVDFHVVESQEDAFGADSVDKHGIVKAAFMAGTNQAVLIAENISSIDDAITTVRHEMVGHYGLRQLLNKDGQYDALLSRTYQARRGELKEEYDWVVKHYPDLVAKDDTRAIADEMLARAAETQKDAGLLTRIYDQIIRLLNNLGLVRGVIDRNELNALIRLSERNLRKNPKPGNLISGGDDFLHMRRAFRDAEDAPTGGNMGMPDETLTDQFVRMAQDSFNRIKKLQGVIREQGGTVSFEADVYGTEERSSSKITHRLRQLDRDHMKPLLDHMDENDITIDELDQYLYAKHATERNEYIASINEDMPDGGSGITNAEAAEMLDVTAERREPLETAASMVYAVNDLSLDDKVAGGHLTQETVNEWRNRWDYYVPLKGKEGEQAGFGTGTGYSISGSGIRKALGRGEDNLAESPTAHSFAQAESTIVRTEKTKVGQALVQLIRENPDPEFWTISQRTYKRFTDLFGEPFEGYQEAPEGLIENLDYHRVTNSEGQVVYKLNPNYKKRDDVFAVMVDGQELLIQIKDPVVMEQLKRMNTTQLNALTRGFGTVNRYLAMINTALNPEFVITNFERDFQTAMANLAGEQSAAIAAKVAKSIPGAVRGIWQSTFDTSGQSEWRNQFEEMESEGGTIGFFGLEDIDTKVRNIQKRLSNQHGVLGRTKRGVMAVRDAILDANLSVENAARLASYKVIKEELIANGLSEKEAKGRAASVAKNLTVNFNRKGELAPVLNSLYLFYNASIQGSARMITALKHPRVRKIAGGIAAASFALAMYNRSAGGEDDDEIPHWDKVSDHAKQTNLIIMHPDGSGDYSKIRLPYGYNVFYYAGTASHDMMFNPRKTATGTAVSMLSAFMNAFNPIQGADLLDTLTPTFLKPIEQDMRNINFMNSPLKPENPFDQYDRPESQKAFKSTNPMLKELMAKLNEVTGGDETHAGLIDVSPEIVKHYVSWLTGGAGMTATRALGTATNLLTGEEIESRNVPLLRTLGGKPSSHFDTERFYSAIRSVAAVEAQLKLLKNTDEWADYKEANSEVHDLALHVRRYKNRIKRLREAQDRAHADDDRELANEKREEIRQQMMEFSLRYDEAIENQEQ